MVDVLVFSAHPDDAEFAMGGTLLTLAKTRKVAQVIATRGEAGTYGTPALREEEGYAAGKIGGYSVEFLDFIDNHIEDTTANIKTFAQVIRTYQPEIIFVPYHTNRHQHTDGKAHHDHSTLGEVVRKAARIAKFKNAKVEGDAHFARRVIYYMVPKYTKPSFVVDITDVVDDLPKLWAAHKTQMDLKGGEITDYLLHIRKSAGLENGVGFAEEFLVEDPLVIESETIFTI